MAERCTQGHTYTEDCNTCTCTDSGVYACTQRACYYGSHFPDTVTGASTHRKRDLAATTSSCDKGQSYNDGCNTCVCAGDKYACTKRFCYIGPQFPDTVPAPSEASTHQKRDVAAFNSGCDKGESYNDGCNTCVCAKDKYVCTQRHCYEGELFPDTAPAATDASTNKKRDVTATNSGCDKGQSYNDGCNTCVCAGDKYACTRRFCYDGPQFPDTSAQSTQSPSRKRRNVEQNSATTEAASRKSRELDESTGKYDLPKENHQKILRFYFENCTSNEVKNQVRHLKVWVKKVIFKSFNLF